LIIEKLKISNLRIIESINLKPGAKLNLITGSNGAGKTTILESIYLLARSRSFRTKHTKNLISTDKQEFIINAKLIQQDGSKKNLGIKKTPNRLDIHLNEIKIEKLSDLARSMPIGIITPNIHKLLDGGPIYRRRLIDWGLFHVEHSYAELFAKYKKVLHQRNSALKQKNIDYKIWDVQLARYGEELTDFRSDYLNRLYKIFISYTKKFNDLDNIQFNYKKGWSETETLRQTLKNKISKDEKRGFTQSGPHRSDMEILIGRVLATEFLSRGQQKTVAILLILSQMSLQNELVDENPILLFDEIAAELDGKRLKKILEIVDSLNCQAFLTSLNTIDNIDLHEFKIERFHVEHGELSNAHH
jgi:DNA replication and repair protein RecF